MNEGVKMKVMELMGINKLFLNKKIVALILAVIGILCSIFITDEEGSRTIVKLLIQILNAIQGGPSAPIEG